jgi:hypothetical protein
MAKGDNTGNTARAGLGAIGAANRRPTGQLGSQTGLGTASPMMNQMKNRMGGMGMGEGMKHPSMDPNMGGGGFRQGQVGGGMQHPSMGQVGGRRFQHPSMNNGLDPKYRPPIGIRANNPQEQEQWMQNWRDNQANNRSQIGDAYGSARPGPGGITGEALYDWQQSQRGNKGINPGGIYGGIGGGMGIGSTGASGRFYDFGMEVPEWDKRKPMF